MPVGRLRVIISSVLELPKTVWIDRIPSEPQRKIRDVKTNHSVCHAINKASSQGTDGDIAIAYRQSPNSEASLVITGEAGAPLPPLLGDTPITTIEITSHSSIEDHSLVGHIATALNDNDPQLRTFERIPTPPITRRTT